MATNALAGNVAAAGAGGGMGGRQATNAPGAGAAGGHAAVDNLGVIVKHRFAKFLKTFSVPLSESNTDGDDDGNRYFEYIEQIHQMKRDDRNTIFVDFNHLLTEDFNLAVPIREEHYRYEPFLREAVRDLVAEYHPDFVETDGIPKEFFVSFFNLGVTLRVRDMKTAEIGSLSAINGTVTRTSEVRPELFQGVFQCQECGTLTAPIDQQFVYTEPTVCRNEACNNTSQWTVSYITANCICSTTGFLDFKIHYIGVNVMQLDSTRSKFVDWQRVRVQENSDEIPPGSLPRTVDVILRHGAVERAKAGDKCTFTGNLVVVPDVSQLLKTGKATTAYKSQSGERMGVSSDGVTGLRRLGVRDLTYRTAFIACAVQRDDHGEENEGESEEFSEAEKNEIEALADEHGGNLYPRMIQSIAPTVFGHEEIKRGVLLQLLGGVHKRTPEGINLRGDINVCIVGDPSTAKSQFLKYSCKFLPRAVYTSGKASSAAGLTASVAKDPDTGEFTIEAGALMLADNGICCIDEFDKMDPADQVAIHEAMEQQTISITKAGIQATLNARTSILAAANPVLGRYDRSMTLSRNVAISPAIMSRFDLFFVVLDDCNAVNDRSIASHIVAVHQHKEQALHPPVPHEKLQKYVRYARTIDPKISDEARAEIVNCYRKLRQNDAVGSHQTSYRITVRQLESLVRLSEAQARLHLDSEVKSEYVQEAFRLLKKSIIRVETGRVQLDEEEEEPTSAKAPAKAERRSAQSQEDGATTQEKGPQKKRTAMPFEKYKAIATEMGRCLRRKEEATAARATEEQEEGEDTSGSVKQESLIEWYFENHPEEYAGLDSSEEVQEVWSTIHKVVNKLVKDRFFIVVKEGEEEAPAEEDDEQQPTEKQKRMKREGNRYLMLNPDVILGDEKVTTED